jgi:uncharacterized phage protein gp47/JayE
MSTQITDRGFERDDLYTILEAMRLDVLRIYPEATLDPATKDGQLLGTFSNAIDQLGQVMQMVYDSGSPSGASGVTLARIVQYNGIQIINGTQSAVDVLFTGNVGAVVPRNSNLRCTVNNALFYTLDDCTILPSGSGIVGALAADVGAIPAPSNTITQMMMPIFGVRTVTNPHDALIGKNRETDYALRLRRAFSVATPSQSILEGIQGGVANIAQVIQVQGYENKTDYTDANGLPPHSFSIVVQGGDDTEIAETIFLREPVGSGQYGNVTVTVADSKGLPHDVTFMRPPVVPIYLTIEIIPFFGWNDVLIPPMLEAIVEWAQRNWLIGIPVVRSQLYIPINATGSMFAVARLMMGTSPGDVQVRDMIPIAFNQIAQINTDQIEVVRL